MSPPMEDQMFRTSPRPAVSRYGLSDLFPAKAVLLRGPALDSNRQAEPADFKVLTAVKTLGRRTCGDAENPLKAVTDQSYRTSPRPAVSRYGLSDLFPAKAVLLRGPALDSNRQAEPADFKVLTAVKTLGRRTCGDAENPLKAVTDQSYRISPRPAVSHCAPVDFPPAPPRRRRWACGSGA